MDDECSAGMEHGWELGAWGLLKEREADMAWRSRKSRRGTSWFVDNGLLGDVYDIAVKFATGEAHSCGTASAELPWLQTDYILHGFCSPEQLERIESNKACLGASRISPIITTPDNRDRGSLGCMRYY